MSYLVIFPSFLCNLALAYKRKNYIATGMHNKIIGSFNKPFNCVTFLKKLIQASSPWIYILFDINACYRHNY
jgi:hypothetical protein